MRALFRSAAKNVLRRTAKNEWFRRNLNAVFNQIAPPEVIVALNHMRSGNSQVFQTRNAIISATVDPGKVLVLAPHPDDEAIGTGGVLCMHLTAGDDCTVLYLTDGGGVGLHRDQLVKQRRAEAETVGREFGFHQIFWDKHDTKLTNDIDTVRDMAELITELTPRIVYVPSFFETHFDHFATSHIVYNALELMPVSDLAVASYEVWDNIPFPNHIVDISAHMDSKKDMARLYKTPMADTDFVRLLSSRAALHHMLYVSSSGEGFAEAMFQLPARNWSEAYCTYLDVLREERSPMLDRLQL